MTVSFSTAPDPSRGPRWRTGVGAAVVLVLAALVVTVVVSALSTAGGAGTTTITSPPSTGASSEPGAPGGAGASAGDAGNAGGALFVHVHGAVVSPGLYELAAGARVVDVVAAAGGFADGADQAGVNLARPLVDGEQLRVPAVGEAVEEPAADVGGGASSPDGAAGAGGGGAVDLNLADDAALQTLPGVGPATAAAILDWREQNGAFRSVDDLLGVPGIGEKTLEKLRPQVTV